MSVSANITSVTDGVCSGIGCRQSAITKGLLNYSVGVDSSSNHSTVWSFNPCSYSFLLEQQSYNFSSADLANLGNTSVVPTVLDWAIGDLTCEEAKMNATSYACKANSFCMESDNGSGYRCNCSAGYQGNPYLSDGCKYINECEDIDQRPHNCTNTSVNTVGSYKCYCPAWYHGDGWKDGKGCVLDQSILVKFSVGIATGLLVLSTGSFWLYVVLKKRKLVMIKERLFPQNGGLLLQELSAQNDLSANTTKIFSAEELDKATNKYHESMIVGQGGYGIVYKGVLPDNRIVAIKKIRAVDKNQIEQFINEVAILSQINHRNVVKLLGCCLETEVPLLVYDFINNGTLFDHIHNEESHLL